MGARMFKKGLAVAVILLFVDVAFAIPINANVSKSSLVSILDREVLEEDEATPIEFELQRIRELVQSVDLRKIIVNTDGVIDTLEEISTIIGENEDIRNYIEKSSDNDCGCDEDDNSLSIQQTSTTLNNYISQTFKVL